MLHGASGGYRLNQVCLSLVSDGLLSVSSLSRSNMRFPADDVKVPSGQRQRESAQSGKLKMDEIKEALIL